MLDKQDQGEMAGTRTYKTAPSIFNPTQQTPRSNIVLGLSRDKVNTCMHQGRDTYQQFRHGRQGQEIRGTAWSRIRRLVPMQSKPSRRRIVWRISGLCAKPRVVA